ncbi:MAG: hypothetical protein QF408_13110 [Pirellulales bacterium]|jgi:hypothetical protein|nr:hypothetical protein [Pirellulales bacterium]HJN64728.1 hypothetical protein [Pirellulales bacterium]|tara:strand:- start:780 stop:1013 length:234 start_codon:yes stop_codon:yes gene_type:complete
MKIDLYTKIVLSVIAVCLGWLVVRDISLVDRAEAFEKRAQVQDVRIVGIKRHEDSNWDPVPMLENTEFSRGKGPQLD